jgi:hypothetical protein
MVSGSPKLSTNSVFVILIPLCSFIAYSLCDGYQNGVWSQKKPKEIHCDQNKKAKIKLKAFALRFFFLNQGFVEIRSVKIQVLIFFVTLLECFQRPTGFCMFIVSLSLDFIIILYKSKMPQNFIGHKKSSM